jgi:hypothetical protein
MLSNGVFMADMEIEAAVALGKVIKIRILP